MAGLPRNLTLSLLTVQAVGTATLLRSVLLERWTTVLVAALLVAGAGAARNARTWGIGLVLATATAFPGAVLLGIAPAWFWLVGLAGLVPFVLTLRHMLRFDRGATALFTAIAGAAGVGGAFVWREAAYAIFYAMR